jgi:hypothetical protein
VAVSLISNSQYRGGVRNPIRGLLDEREGVHRRSLDALKRAPPRSGTRLKRGAAKGGDERKLVELERAAAAVPDVAEHKRELAQALGVAMNEDRVRALEVFEERDAHHARPHSAP